MKGTPNLANSYKLNGSVDDEVAEHFVNELPLR